MLYLDCETYSLNTLPVLIQYSHSDKIGKGIVLVDVWDSTPNELITLLTGFCQETVVAYNLSFDWFMMVKLYNHCKRISDDYGRGDEKLIDSWALTQDSIDYNYFLKPVGALDIMLHFRRDRFQHLMRRIRPTIYDCSRRLMALLDELTDLDKTLFAGQKVSKRWEYSDNDNVYLAWKPSFALKNLIKVIYPEEETLELDMYFNDELYEGYNDDNAIIYNVSLFKEEDSKTVNRPNKMNHWKQLVGKGAGYCHNSCRMVYYQLGKCLSHWRYNKRARQYAENDVRYLQMLTADFQLKPDHYDDSLAVMSANTKCRGFHINTKRAEEMYEHYKKIENSAVKSPGEVLEWVGACFNEMDRAIMLPDTCAKTLNALIDQAEEQSGKPINEVNPCNGVDVEDNWIEAGIRADSVIKARKARNRAKIFEKLIRAGRFHPEMRVCGTISNRMSGGGGLNAQGIAREKEIRACFDMNDGLDGYVLSGGDFDGQEISIAAAIYDDDNMNEDLANGVKLHAIMAMGAFDMTYDEVMASKGTVDDKYVKGKNGVFALFYGGNEHTLVNRVGVTLKKAKEAMTHFESRYPKLKKLREETMAGFSSDTWTDYVSGMFGHKRYFSLEKQLRDIFVSATEKIDWKGEDRVRRERVQTTGEADKSALWGAIYGLQSRCGRQAINHRVQATGSEVTKMLQERVWDLQPVGASPFRVVILNVHDELIVYNDCRKEVEGTVVQFIEEFKEKIPFLGMEWNSEMKSWAEKG